VAAQAMQVALENEFLKIRFRTSCWQSILFLTLSHSHTLSLSLSSLSHCQSHSHSLYDFLGNSISSKICFIWTFSCSIHSEEKNFNNFLLPKHLSQSLFFLAAKRCQNKVHAKANCTNALQRNAPLRIPPAIRHWKLAGDLFGGSVTGNVWKEKPKRSENFAILVPSWKKIFLRIF
jgi:hypothetical protein